MHYSCAHEFADLTAEPETAIAFPSKDSQSSLQILLLIWDPTAAESRDQHGTTLTKH